MRAQVALILTIVVVSVGGSYGLYFFARDANFGTTNRGEFVQPPVTASELGVDLDAHVADVPVWWVWLVVPSSCSNTCAHQLDTLRTLHVLLNDDAHRLRRGWLALDGSALDSAITATFPKLVTLKADPGGRLQHAMYVVDPLGNLVFRYAPDVPPQDVLTDLKRLLKVSQIG